MARYPGFISGTNNVDSIIADGSRSINMMPEIVGATGKNPTVLIDRPGLTLLEEVVASKNSVRGMWEGDLVGTDYYYIVLDGSLYKASINAGDTTLIGTVSEDADSMPIQYAVGDTTLDTLIVSNGIAYKLVSGVLSTISDLSSYTCLDCAYIGGYFIVITDDYRFLRSAVGDVDSWDATDYDYPDPQPEPLVGVIESQNQLWFFGQTRTNVWMLDSTVALGLSRITGILVKYGLWSAATLWDFDNGIIWLSRLTNGTARVCLARNYAPQKISTHSQDTVFVDNVGSLDTAYAYVIDERGHEVYCLSVPGASTTLCIDASTWNWHERAYGTTYALHLGKSHMAKEGINYIGARNSGKVYTSDFDDHDDDGVAIRHARRGPHVHFELNEITYPRLRLDMEKCLGADGSNPVIYMRYSNDGGKNFSSPISTWLGETTDDPNTIRVEWNRLGTGTDYVFEVYSDESLRQCWIDAYIN